MFFILVTYLIWHWAKGNPFLKKQFSSNHGVFYHLMSSVQSECSCPFIFYEQKTSHAGMLHFTEVKTLCKAWKMPRIALLGDGEGKGVKYETIKILETLFYITNRHYFKNITNLKIREKLSVSAHLLTFWCSRRFQTFLQRETICFTYSCSVQHIIKAQ